MTCATRNYRMPTRITLIEGPGGETRAIKAVGADCQPGGTGTAVLKVEGTLYLKDANLLEKLCRELENQTRRPVTLELAGLSYVDSESAAVLCRMKREQGVRLQGLHLFIEKVVELAEACQSRA